MSRRSKSIKSQKRITKSEFFQDDDNNAKLIRFVYERPALYNYKLPVKERSHTYKNELWEEVAFSLGVSVTECRNRWKNLRDTFQLYRHKHMSEKTLTKWKFSELLSFLENLHTYRPRRSSSKSRQQKVLVSVPDISENPLHEIDIDHNIAIDIDIDDDDGNNEACLMEEFQSGHHHGIDYTDMTIEKELYKSDYSESDPIDEINADLETTNEKLWQNNSMKIVNVKSVGKRKSISSCISLSPEKCNRMSTSPSTCDKGTPEPKPDMDELDLLMEFLKKKIRRLQPVDITNIQMQFINIVFQKEKENRNNSSN